MLRLPAAGEAVPVTLVIVPSQDGEEWRRAFAGEPLLTRQWLQLDGLLVEQVGLAEMRFHLEERDGGLVYHPVGATLRWGWLRIPLPIWLTPVVNAQEAPATQQDKIKVLVRVSLPAVGLLISYEGLMTPIAEEP
jgi:hypothetical protein